MFPFFSPHDTAGLAKLSQFVFHIHCAVNLDDSDCNRLDVLLTICLRWYIFLIETSDERPMIRTCSVILVLFVLIGTANRPASISYSGRNYPRQIRAKCNSWSVQNRKRIRNREKEKYKKKHGIFYRKPKIFCRCCCYLNGRWKIRINGEKREKINTESSFVYHILTFCRW